VPRHLEFILPTRQFADVVIPNGDSSQVQRDEILETLARAIRTHLGPAQR
jgi:uridine kinase